MNEHALKAAQTLQATGHIQNLSVVTEQRVAEIIVRTALEPATKELREALKQCLENRFEGDKIRIIVEAALAKYELTAERREVLDWIQKNCSLKSKWWRL